MKLSLSSIRTQFRVSGLALLVALTLITGFIRPQCAIAQHSMLDKASKHHKMVAAAAGVGTYAALKRSAARKKAQGRKLNFAERHPMMSGAAAGLVTNHMLKKHYKNIHHN